MKNNKAPLHGEMPLELIKNDPFLTLKLTAESLNKLINEVEVHDVSKIAYISSIYKGGNKIECKKISQLYFLGNRSQNIWEILWRKEVSVVYMKAIQELNRDINRMKFVEKVRLSLG